MTFPTPSSHPRSCQICGGSGWEPGPSTPYIANGVHGEYTTVQPCTHHWSNDDPDTDAHGLDRTTPITFDQYYARLLARVHDGDPDAVVELRGWERAMTGQIWNPDDE